VEDDSHSVAGSMANLSLEGKDIPRPIASAVTLNLEDTLQPIPRTSTTFSFADAPRLVGGSAPHIGLEVGPRRIKLRAWMRSHRTSLPQMKAIARTPQDRSFGQLMYKYDSV
jgi:hypothetical protein